MLKCSALQFRGKPNSREATAKKTEAATKSRPEATTAVTAAVAIAAAPVVSHPLRPPNPQHVAQVPSFSEQRHFQVFCQKNSFLIHSTGNSPRNDTPQLSASDFNHLFPGSFNEALLT